MTRKQIPRFLWIIIILSNVVLEVHTSQCTWNIYWWAQYPERRAYCISHSAEHLQHIRGVTNPFMLARTFQRTSVTVNITSSGFHTSEQMCVSHSNRAWPRTNLRVCGCAAGISAVYVLAADVVFHAGHPCLTGVFRAVNQRRGWEECQSVRRAPVKSPPALSLSVLTPLNLSLSSLTLTHSTSIDTRYPAALQRPEENPLRWLSIRGEHRSLQRRKDYIMHWHTEQDASGFSACLLSFLDIYGWKKRREGERKNYWENERSTDWTNLPEHWLTNGESSHVSMCK